VTESSWQQVIGIRQLEAGSRHKTSDSSRQQAVDIMWRQGAGIRHQIEGRRHQTVGSRHVTESSRHHVAGIRLQPVGSTMHEVESRQQAAVKKKLYLTTMSRNAKKCRNEIYKVYKFYNISHKNILFDLFPRSFKKNLRSRVARS